MILRNRVKTYLLHEILKGRLKIGKTINLAKVSRQLNVSVTPVREALSQLEQARIIKAIPNRGFIVPELSLQEASDLYHTLAELEVMALEHSKFDADTIAQLSRELLRLQQAHTETTRLRHRVAFHRCLVKKCTNTILLQVLRDLESRILFYEQVFITDATFYEKTDNQNEAIVRAIAEDNLPTAALILKMNWMSILDYVKNQIIKQQPVHF
ncbi:MAG: GntR family transcriptional regulator [Bacteroidota bacterium]